MQAQWSAPINQTDVKNIPPNTHTYTCKWSRPTPGLSHSFLDKRRKRKKKRGKKSSFSKSMILISFFFFRGFLQGKWKFSVSLVSSWQSGVNVWREETELRIKLRWRWMTHSRACENIQQSERSVIHLLRADMRVDSTLSTWKWPL